MKKGQFIALASSANRHLVKTMNSISYDFIETMFSVEPIIAYLVIAYFYFSRICKTMEVYWQSRK